MGKGVGTVNRRTSSERWARMQAVQGSGGSRRVVQCRRRKSMGLGNWPLPNNPSMRASLGLASDCQSKNIIADATGQDTFTWEDLLRLLALAMGDYGRLVHMPAFLGLALTQLVGLLHPVHVSQRYPLTSSPSFNSQSTLQ